MSMEEIRSYSNSITRTLVYKALEFLIVHVIRNGNIWDMVVYTLVMNYITLFLPIIHQV